MIEHRVDVRARSAEGICVFKEQTLDRGAWLLRRFWPLMSWGVSGEE